MNKEEIKAIILLLETTLGSISPDTADDVVRYGWFEGSSHYWSGRRDLGDVIKDEVFTDDAGDSWLRIAESEIESSVWEYKKPTKNKQHPTMKPVALCTRGIMNSSERGDIVLDTFLGSGSTLIACEKVNRKCYGMELDPKFVDVIVQRWVDYTKTTTVIKNGKEETWELSEQV